MLVVPLSQVMPATMKPAGQDFINVVECLALAFIFHRPGLELDHG
jgi:hypothetical protein